MGAVMAVEQAFRECNYLHGIRRLMTCCKPAGSW